MSSANLVAKIWSFCDTLRDDGVSYVDYLEQITYLLFLKMADEYSRLPNGTEYNIPESCNWESIRNKDLKGLTIHYVESLETLASSGGMLSKIFDGAQNKIHDPRKLKKLINLIDEESWVNEKTDVKGDIYESLLQKNAESSGAGQYFTPRPVIEAMVNCIQPQPMQTIADPSCGTGGFFLGALNFLNKNFELDNKALDFLKFKTFHGWEIVPATARLCLMNLFLHGVGDLKTTPDIEVVDSLKNPLDENEKVDIVLANPPFGKSSSDIPTNDKKKAKQEGYYLREDFWTTTSNKQLSFLQHIISMLKDSGQAAIVLPDNVLFEGGAGELIRKKLLEETELHTILRLPTGIFYAQGVKANVLFLRNKTASKNNDDVIWFYDYRTNVHHTPKNSPLRYSDLKDFVECYHHRKSVKEKSAWSETNTEGRWRKYSYEEIKSRDKISLDIFWLKDDSVIDLENLPDSNVLISDIIENMESALESLRTMKEAIEN